MADGPPLDLIVNADDFGWSHGVNRGIIETHRSGVVTSASILAPGAAFEDAVACALDTPSLATGVHLSFYRGRSVLAPELVPSLLDSQGMFLGSWRLIVWRIVTGRLSLDELRAELRAQIELVIASGIAPTHLNSEKHLHLWPSVFDVVCELAEEYAIPYVRVVRERTSAHAIPVGLTTLSGRDADFARRCGVVTPASTIGVTEQPVDTEALARLLSEARGPLCEMVVHPGFLDDEFWTLQRTLPNKLVQTREQELATLTDPRACELIEAAGCTLVSRAESPVAERQ